MTYKFFLQIDWNPASIQWLIDGQVVRTVNKIGNMYPDTPGQVQLRYVSVHEPWRSLMTAPLPIVSGMVVIPLHKELKYGLVVSLFHIRKNRMHI